MKLLSKILVIAIVLFSVMSSHAMAAPYDITEYSIPSQDSETTWLNYGPDGNAWYASRSTDMLGVVNKNTGNITEFPVPNIGADCGGLTAGPDGNLWFVRGSTNNISKRDMTTGVITDYPIENESGCLWSPVAGPDGNIWFSGESGYIAKMTLTGEVTKYEIPDNGQAWILRVGVDGNLWFVDLYSEKIGKITTDGIFTMITTPSSPIDVTLDRNNNIWYLNAVGNNLLVSKLNSQGEFVASYTVASGEVFSYSLILGKDGKIWVAVLGTDQLASIDSSGTIEYFNVPSPGEGPILLASSNDTDLWYISLSGNTVGRLEMPPTESNGPTSDSDPIPDSVEDAAPGNGDGNNDGTPDSQQSNVTSLPNASGDYITLAVPEGVVIDTTTIAQASTLSTKDIAYNYPLGLVSFTATTNVGATIPIELYFYTNQQASSFTPRKYNTTNQTYTTLSTQTQTSLTQTTINNQPVLKLSYQLQDGGPLDQDNTANGTIVDPVGLAAASVGVPNTGLH